MKCAYCKGSLRWSDLRDRQWGEMTCPRCLAQLRIDPRYMAAFLTALLAGLVAGQVLLTRLGAARPWFVLGSACWIGLAWVWNTRHLRLLVVLPGIRHCPACGYDLRGAPRAREFRRCPECGTPVADD